MGRDTLKEALIYERTQRLLEFDRAHPDVGFPLVPVLARRIAIKELEKEGKI